MDNIYPLPLVAKKAAEDLVKAKLNNSRLKIHQLEQKYVDQINTLEQNRKKQKYVDQFNALVQKYVDQFNALEQNRKKQNNNGSEIAEKDAKTTMTKLKNEIEKYEELQTATRGDLQIWDIEVRYRIIEYIREKNETKTSPQEELKKIEEFKKIEEELKNISPDSNKKEENNYA